MENASKALLIAGGILMALLVIGALLLMFNQLSYYQKSNSTNEKEAQLVEFNKEFVKYTYGDIKGYELISLINKVVDYNEYKRNNPTENSFNYDIEITINVTLGKTFANKFGINGKLSVFKSNITYVTRNSNDEFSKVISTFSGYETKYGLNTMSKLSSYYNSIATYEELKAKGKSEDEIKIAGGKSIKEVVGRDINITSADIAKYREYSEFKSSTFRTVGEEKYQDGQISEISFQFVE